MPDQPVSAFFDLQKHDCLVSTNQTAMELAEQGAPEGAVIWALEQTGGRGRRGRQWVSNKGNLFFSIILKPKVPLPQSAQLGFIAAIAIHESIDSLFSLPHETHCKWPNDVLLNGKKVAGILMESFGGDFSIPADAVVLGIGINVSSAPEEAEYPAISFQQAGELLGVEQTLKAFLLQFESRYRDWQANGFEKYRQDWLWRCKGLGDKIEVRLDNQSRSGIFQTIDNDGALLLEENGKQEKISVGAVFFPGSTESKEMRN